MDAKASTKVKRYEVKEWKNQVVGQCMSWINVGLQPRAITRDLDWGVEVPMKDAKASALRLV